ncbi:MAG: hypothetical protein HYS22_05445 [Deltaproteobacteria bacterium]|nr:hypothetical protein [Deltaproteobacteria bacterium]
MKKINKIKRGPVLWGGLLLIALPVYFAGCGSSSTDDTGDGGGTTTATITNNEEAMQSLPNADPTSMDYGISASASLSAFTAGNSSKAQQGPSLSGMGCLLDALYAAGSAPTRFMDRIFICKARGVFNLKKEGKSDITLPEGGDLYISYSVGGGFDKKQQEGGGGSSDSSSDNLMKMKHTKGEGLGTFDLFLCSGGSQTGYAHYSVANDIYTGRVLFKRTSDSCLETSYTRKAGAITSENFTGEVLVKFKDGSSNAMVRVVADGAGKSNTLQAKHTGQGTALAFWSGTDKNGCISGSSAQGSSGSIPFDFTVGSDKDKSYSTFSGSDSSTLCAKLPQDPAVVACPDFASEETWDCGTTGKTVNAFSDPSALEDAGGEGCTMANDFFEGSVDPGSCF